MRIEDLFMGRERFALRQGLGVNLSDNAVLLVRGAASVATEQGVFVRLVESGSLVNPELVLSPSTASQLCVLVESAIALFATIPIAEFRQEFRRNPALYQSLASELTYALGAASETVAMLADRSAESRVKTGLDMLESVGIDPIAGVPRDRLAELFGINRTTISKALTKLGRSKPKGRRYRPMVRI